MLHVHISIIHRLDPDPGKSPSTDIYLDPSASPSTDLAPRASDDLPSSDTPQVQILILVFIC